MAFAVKITGYSKADEKVLMEIEPSWWDAGELMRDTRFVQSRKGRVYCAYDADLTLTEMRELHERYKGNVTTVQKWLCFRFNRLSPPCRNLQDALFHRPHRYSRFHVNVFEWDSGL
jgi:hypothetical protein